MTWPALPCPGSPRNGDCGHLLTVIPGQSPEWCPACERVFTTTEMREMWERTIHLNGSKLVPIKSDDSPLMFND